MHAFCSATCAPLTPRPLHAQWGTHALIISISTSLHLYQEAPVLSACEENTESDEASCCRTTLLLCSSGG